MTLIPWWDELKFDPYPVKRSVWVDVLLPLFVAFFVDDRLIRGLLPAELERAPALFVDPIAHFFALDVKLALGFEGEAVELVIRLVALEIEADVYAAWVVIGESLSEGLHDGLTGVTAVDDDMDPMRSVHAAIQDFELSKVHAFIVSVERFHGGWITKELRPAEDPNGFDLFLNRGRVPVKTWENRILGLVCYIVGWVVFASRVTRRSLPSKGAFSPACMSSALLPAPCECV